MEDLKIRTRQYALRVIRLYTALPKTTEAQVIGKQLLRSGTSVDAHYAESQRAKSNADFINKIEGALQELEESAYWLDLRQDVEIFSKEHLIPLRQETEALIAILSQLSVK